LLTSTTAKIVPHQGVATAGAPTTSKSPSIASHPQPTKTPLMKAQYELQKLLHNWKNEL